MSQVAEPSTIQEWAEAFYEYLLDNKYDAATGQKLANIQNIYNLLFVHEQKMPDAKLQGDAPDADKVTEVMIQQKLLTSQEDGTVTVEKKSDDRKPATMY